MMNRASYKPGPAVGAEVRKDGAKWTLVLVRELRHPPVKVWEALTSQQELREWAPFDADRSLDAVGPVTLTTVGAPKQITDDTEVTRAEAPSLLEYHWGGNDLRWQLEPAGVGTRLTLWHNIPKNFISMGAAGWHICIDVMDQYLAGEPLGRIVAGDAMNFEWQRLNGEYAKQFGITPPAWPPQR
ncbi:MAG TPA: SRPBCC family protein [Steroidobacteraceae bacterium]|jgi:uncharacterized protein YndB with AHSA1/START domain